MYRAHKIYVIWLYPEKHANEKAFSTMHNDSVIASNYL